MRAFRRRQYLISKLQVRLLLTMAIYGFIFLLGIGVLVFLPIALDLHDPELTEAQRAKAGAAFLALDLRLWPAIAVMLLAIGVHAVLVTHRIVGPLYRLRQVMGAAAGGDLAIIARIRKRDLLHAEADSLNELLRAVQQRWEGVEEDAIRLREVLDRALAVPDEGAEEDTLRELSECLGRLEARLGDRTGSAPGGDDCRGLDEPLSALPAGEPASQLADPGGRE